MTSIFNNFPWLKINFYGFPDLENETLKFHDFPDFQMTHTPLVKVFLALELI